MREFEKFQNNELITSVRDIADFDYFGNMQK